VKIGLGGLMGKHGRLGCGRRQSRESSWLASAGILWKTAKKAPLKRFALCGDEKYWEKMGF
jgi:hypothetical protein